MRVLIVDAMQQRLDHTRKLMERLGNTVLACGHDGFWALMAAKKTAPDLIVLDADIPLPTCDKIVESIRRELPRTLVLIGAGNTSATGPLADDPRTYVVRKPFTMASVNEALVKLSAPPSVASKAPIMRRIA